MNHIKQEDRIEQMQGVNVIEVAPSWKQFELLLPFTLGLYCS